MDAMGRAAGVDATGGGLGAAGGLLAESFFSSAAILALYAFSRSSSSSMYLATLASMRLSISCIFFTTWTSKSSSNFSTRAGMSSNDSPTSSMASSLLYKAWQLSLNDSHSS